MLRKVKEFIEDYLISVTENFEHIEGAKMCTRNPGNLARENCEVQEARILFLQRDQNALGEAIKRRDRDISYLKGRLVAAMARGELETPLAAHHSQFETGPGGNEDLNLPHGRGESKELGMYVETGAPESQTQRIRELEGYVSNLRTEKETLEIQLKDATPAEYVEHLRRRASELVGLLRDREWERGHNSGINLPLFECRSCGALKTAGHNTGCKLKTLLDKYPKPA